MTEMVELKTPVDYLVAEGKEKHDRLLAAQAAKDAAAEEKLAAERKAVWQLVIDKACQQIPEDALHFGFRPTESSPIDVWRGIETWNDLYWFLPDVSVPVVIRPGTGKSDGTLSRNAYSVDSETKAQEDEDGRGYALLDGRYYYGPDKVEFAACKPKFDLDWSDTEVVFVVDRDEKWWRWPEIPVYIASTREGDYAKALAQRDAWLTKEAPEREPVVPGSHHLIEQAWLALDQVPVSAEGWALAASTLAIAQVLASGTVRTESGY